MKPKVYLDNCCYGRPYDKPSNLRIIFEAQAKMAIQSMIVDGTLELASSSYVLYENSFKEDEAIRNHIIGFIRNHAEHFVSNPKAPIIQELHGTIMATGIKSMDAYHVACAIALKCDYFITTDDRILKYRDGRIKIMSPIQFITEEV